jgi:glutamate synthase (NADPH) small chain
MDAYKEIVLHIPEEIERLMERRGIRTEDVQETINHAETTGEKFINSSGRSLASLRPDRVTYWVEYSQAGEEYVVHTAYSHRMELKRKGTP